MASAGPRRPIGGASGPGWREAGVLLVGLFGLYMYMRWGRANAFRAFFADDFAHLPYATMHPYVYSSVNSVVWRLLLPVVFVVFVLREHLREFGFALVPSASMARIYVLLFALMLPIVWVAAGQSSFQAKYPFWDGANESWRLLALYELRYFFIFLSGEAFWRGFLLFGLARRFGWHALSISMVPYVLVHWGKPVPEVLGAVVTAYVLGYLALRHRSFWLGVALHFGIAFFMDVFVLARTGALPSSF